MYILLKWFKNSTLRSTLYRLSILFIICYLLLTIYKTLELSKLEETVVIDVRTKTEWEEGHRPGAIHLPHEDISQYSGDKEQKIVLYCNTGRRANIAKQKLLEMGYKNIDVESY